MKKITGIIFVLILTSCSAKWHLRKAMAKDPSLLTGGTTVVFDTVVVTEPRYINDTLLLRENDTVTIEKDRIVTRLIRLPNDTVLVDVTCPSDTIRITTTKEVPTIVYKKGYTFKQWSVGLLFVCVAFLLAFGLIRALKAS